MAHPRAILRLFNIHCIRQNNGTNFTIYKLFYFQFFGTLSLPSTQRLVVAGHMEGPSYAGHAADMRLGSRVRCICFFVLAYV